MRSVIKKAQKDWDWMQKLLEQEKAKMMDRVNLDEIRSDIEVRAKKLEKQVENTVKQLEPTYQKVLEGLRKNAEKVGIDVHKVEGALKEGVATARQTLGIVGDLSASQKTTKRKSVKKPDRSSAKKVVKKATKVSTSEPKVAKKKSKKISVKAPVGKEKKVSAKSTPFDDRLNKPTTQKPLQTKPVV